MTKTTNDRKQQMTKKTNNINKKYEKQQTILKDEKTTNTKNSNKN